MCILFMGMLVLLHTVLHKFALLVNECEMSQSELIYEPSPKKKKITPETSIDLSNRGNKISWN